MEVGHWNPLGTDPSVSPLSRVGATLPPLMLYVTYRRFQAGMFDAYGGLFLDSERVNEDTFIAAVTAQIETIAGRAGPDVAPA